MTKMTVSMDGGASVDYEVPAGVAKAVVDTLSASIYVPQDYPQMLYRGDQTLTVNDDQEKAAAQAEGFDVHHTLQKPTAAASEPQAPTQKQPAS